MLVGRNAHNSTLVHDSIVDALANPPYSEGEETEAACLVECLCCFHQSEITLRDKVREFKARVAERLSYADHETEVCHDKRILCLLPLTSTFLNNTREMCFLVWGEEVDAAYLTEVV